MAVTSLLKSHDKYLTQIERATLLIQGKESQKFLQGITTNDVRFMTQKETPHSQANMFLNSQGRVHIDFFLTRGPQWTKEEPQFYMDVHPKNREAIIEHLRRFKLRMKVNIEDITDDVSIFQVLKMNHSFGEPGQLISVQKDAPKQAVTQFVDPRFGKLGIRIISPKSLPPQIPDAKQSPVEVYHLLRLYYGIPEQPETDGRIPISFKLHLARSISVHKGCFIGQEVVNRAFRKGSGRKTVLPFIIDPPKNQLDQILRGDFAFNPDFLNESKNENLFEKAVKSGKKRVGNVVGNCFNIGLAYVEENEVLKENNTPKTDLELEGLPIYFYQPKWLDFDLDKHKFA